MECTFVIHSCLLLMPEWKADPLFFFLISSVTSGKILFDFFFFLPRPFASRHFPQEAQEAHAD
jgi:hypothetical protein